MTAIWSGVTPNDTNCCTWAKTICASPWLYRDPELFVDSYMSQSAVSIYNSGMCSTSCSLSHASWLSFRSSIDSKSFNVWCCTLACVCNALLYNAWLAQLAMRSFIRYWTFSIRDIGCSCGKFLLFVSLGLYNCINRSNMVNCNAFCTAELLVVMVGGNCKWSPAKITLDDANSTGIQQAASMDCAASSIMTISNCRLSSDPGVFRSRCCDCFVLYNVAAPTHVVKTTCAWSINSWTMVSSRTRISFRNVFISWYNKRRLILLLLLLELRFIPFVIDDDDDCNVFMCDCNSLRTSWTISVPSAHWTRASKL